jgi:hypothetical protein
VPTGAKAVWRELRRPPVEVALVREGDRVRVVIPGIGAWNVGYLEICEE